MPTEWTTQDDAVMAAAISGGAVFTKERKTYIFVGFASSAARAAFKTAIASVPNITVTDWAYPHDTDLFVVKVVPR